MNSDRAARKERLRATMPELADDEIEWALSADDMKRKFKEREQQRARVPPLSDLYPKTDDEQPAHDAN